MSDQHHPVLAALILAASASRMESNPALLPMDNERVISRIVRGFRQAGIERIGVVIGHEAAEIEPVLRKLGVEVISNPEHERGMYSSIQCGIASLAPEVEACFVLPASIPLVRPATIVALAARFAAEQAPITYPRFSGQRGHPPLLSRFLFAEILAGKGDGGLRALLTNHQGAASDVNVLDEGIMLEMDSPDAYAQLAKLALRRHLPTPAECEAILATRPTSESLRRHGRAVTAVARTIANRLLARGVAIDLNLVLAASLLHDIAKGQPGRAETGAALVEGLGYPVVANVIRQHISMTFDSNTPNEAAVVFLADKLVNQDRRVSLEERYRPTFERFRDQPDALQGATRRYEAARAILAVVERKVRAPISSILADSGVPALS